MSPHISKTKKIILWIKTCPIIPLWKTLTFSVLSFFCFLSLAYFHIAFVGDTSAVSKAISDQLLNHTKCYRSLELNLTLYGKSCHKPSANLTQLLPEDIYNISIGNSVKFQFSVYYQVLLMPKEVKQRVKTRLWRPLSLPIPSPLHNLQRARHNPNKPTSRNLHPAPRFPQKRKQQRNLGMAAARIRVPEQSKSILSFLALDQRSSAIFPFIPGNRSDMPHGNSRLSRHNALLILVHGPIRGERKQSNDFILFVPLGRPACLCSPKRSQRDRPASPELSPHAHRLLLHVRLHLHAVDPDGLRK